MKGGSVGAQVVDPYAEALMSIAQERNLTDNFGEIMRNLANLLEESPELQGLLENPLISSDDKKAVLQRIVGNTNEYLQSFLKVLVDRRRVMFLELVCKKYLEILRDLNNAVLAEVTSATELDESQKRAISDKVKSITGATSVEIKTSIDADLIGGVIIKVGSQVLDASIQGQLRRISYSLMSAA